MQQRGHTFRWVAEFGVIPVHRDTELFAYGGCGPVGEQSWRQTTARLSLPAPRMGPLVLRLSPLGGISGRTGGAGPLNALRTMCRVMGSSGTTDPSEGSCVATSGRNGFIPFRVHVEGQTVKYSSCQCPIGRDKCHHMAAVLIWVEKNVSRTDVECAWKRAKTPSTDQIAAKRVSEMTPSTTQAGIKRPVTQEDKDWVQANLSQLGRLTGIGWILSPETPRTLPIKTFEGLVTNPDYAEAEDKALHLLSSFVVTNREKQQIERATVGQAKNALWSAYRQKRITASNFGLVLAAVKRKSYPPYLFNTAWPVQPQTRIESM
ncbi:unnamed protein product [Boreogadus saida]